MNIKNEHENINKNYKKVSKKELRENSASIPHGCFKWIEKDAESVAKQPILKEVSFLGCNNVLLLQSLDFYNKKFYILNYFYHHTF